jgi:hypothetical protein
MFMKKSLCLVPTRYKASTVEIARELVTMLKQLDFAIFVEEGFEEVGVPSIVPFQKIDYFVLIGGDGSFVASARKYLAWQAPFIGVSAGTNVHCPTMQTTNDMPIVRIKKYNTLNSIPFQLNVHYNTIPSPKWFSGDTRDGRLKEYLENNRTFDSSSIPTFVLGLREGSMIHVSGDKAELVGFKSRPAELIMLDNNGDLIKKQLAIGSRIDNLLRLQV